MNRWEIGMEDRVGIKREIEMLRERGRNGEEEGWGLGGEGIVGWC